MDKEADYSRIRNYQTDENDEFLSPEATEQYWQIVNTSLRDVQLSGTRQINIFDRTLAIGLTSLAIMESLKQPGSPDDREHI